MPASQALKPLRELAVAFPPLSVCIISPDASFCGRAKTGHWSKIGRAVGQTLRRRVGLAPALSGRPAFRIGDAFALSRPSALFPSAPLAHPRWYLFGADLLLVAAALVVMYKSPAPLTGNEKFFGAAAVVLGASLG